MECLVEVDVGAVGVHVVEGGAQPVRATRPVRAGSPRPPAPGPLAPAAPSYGRRRTSSPTVVAKPPGTTAEPDRVGPPACCGPASTSSATPCRAASGRGERLHQDLRGRRVADEDSLTHPDTPTSARAEWGLGRSAPLACCRHARTVPPVLDQRLVAHRRPPAAPRRQPRHGDRSSAPSGSCAGALVFFPQGWLLGRRPVHHRVRVQRHDRRRTWPAPVGQVRRSARSSTRPSTGSATGDLRRPRDVLRRPGRQQLRAPRSRSTASSMGSVTSYARARAESLGMQAKVGIAERADRLVADPGRHRLGRPVPAPRRRRPGDVADPDRPRAPGRWPARSRWCSGSSSYAGRRSPLQPPTE